MLDEKSKSWIQKNLRLFTPEVKTQAMERLSTCRDCPQLRPTLNTCKQCGCSMPAKVFLKNARCPLNKWGVMKGD